MKKIALLAMLFALLVPSLACNTLLPPASSTTAASPLQKTQEYSEPTLEPGLPEDSSQGGSESGCISWVPDGKPPESWKEVPIMPGALCGGETEGSTSSYAYAIKTTTRDVLNYYAREMVNLGWTVFTTSEPEGEDEMVFLMFELGDRTASISSAILEQGYVYVMIVE